MKRLLLLCWLIALPVLAQPDIDTAASQQPWVVGRAAVHYPPMRMPVDAERSGVYFELALAVLERAGIPYQVKVFSYEQSQPAYKRGEVDVTCCYHPDWWLGVGGIDPRLLSMPLTDSRDLWVFPRGAPFNPFSEIDGKRVALISDFAYPTVDEWRFQRLNYDDSQQLLTAVDQQQADVGIVNEWVLLWELKKRSYALDLPLEQSRVHVHLLVSPKARPLLPELNRAIEGLRADGSVDEIIRSYLPAYRPVEFPSDQYWP